MPAAAPGPARPRWHRVLGALAVGGIVLISLSPAGAAAAAPTTLPTTLPKALPTTLPKALPTTLPKALPTTQTAIAAYTVVTDRAVSRSGLIARAVLPSGVGCPTMHASVDGRALGVRTIPRRIAPSTWPAFASVKVCEARIPVGATAVHLAGHALPARMPAEVRRLAMLGDTGCRISSSQVQDCASSGTWPLATISARIAEERPDIVLHVGDYFYREAACPSANVSWCGGSPAPIPGAPFTDTDYGWIADALLPMSPLFATAPIIFTRGNHEECSRGGNGYYLFFDHGWQNASRCAPTNGVAPQATNRPYPIDLPLPGGTALRLVMVDSANGVDGAAGATALPGKRTYYERARALAAARPQSWLVTHRPLFSLLSSTYFATDSPSTSQWMSVGEEVASYGLLGRYDLIIGSHVHLAQSVQIPGQPGQLVLGNGGTLLEPPVGYANPGYGPLGSVGGQPVIAGLAPYPPATSLWTAVRFGYAMATPAVADGEWSIAMKGPDGRAFARCVAAERQVDCR